MRWTPDGERVLFWSETGLIVADQEGNADYCVLWETLAQEWSTRVDCVRYPPSLKHRGWSDGKVSIVHVCGQDAPYRLLLIDPDEAIGEHGRGLQGRFLSIPTTGTATTFRLSRSSIWSVTADGLVIGAGRGTGPLERTISRDWASTDQQDESVLFAYDLRDDSFAAVGTRRLAWRGLTFDAAAGCWWWLWLGNDSAALMRLDLTRDPLRFHEEVQCAVIPWSRSDADNAVIRLARDGIVRVRRLKGELTDDGYSVRFTQYAFDPSTGTTGIQTDSSIQGPSHPRRLAVNPTGTMGAYFRNDAPGELVFVSLVDGSTRTVRYEKTTWLREGWPGHLLDGSDMLPKWIDDHRVCTLWPSDMIRDRMEIVVWDTSGEEVVGNVISERWPEEVRPSALKIRRGFWDTL